MKSGIYRFYADGFKSMTVGKKLWIIIIIKLFVIFIVLKLFFFHDYLNSRFQNDLEKSDYILQELTKRN